MVGSGYDGLMSGAGGIGGMAPKTTPGSPTGDIFKRRLGGALGGFGQGLMSPEFRGTYNTAATGGYQDLIQKQHVNDFVRTGDVNPARPTNSRDMLNEAKLSADRYRAQRRGPGAVNPMGGGF
jgi:hypothetical protein